MSSLSRLVSLQGPELASSLLASLSSQPTAQPEPVLNLSQTTPKQNVSSSINLHQSCELIDAGLVYLTKLSPSLLNECTNIRDADLVYLTKLSPSLLNECTNIRDADLDSLSKRTSLTVSFEDFQLSNTWKPDVDGPRWIKWEAGDDGLKGVDEGPKYLIDMTTGRRYWNESEECVRLKCFLLTLFTPIYHLIASVVDVFYRIVKLVSGSHFWMDKEGEKSYSLKGRLKDAGQDFLRVLTAPFAFIGLELAAIYGIFNPYDGRKLYASIERAQYGTFILAPCFQPDPKYHALGGDPKQKNAI